MSGANRTGSTTDFGLRLVGDVVQVFRLEFRRGFGDFLIENHFDFHPAVQGPAGFGEIAGHRLAEGATLDFHGGGIEGKLFAEKLRHFRGAGFGQPLVVAEGGLDSHAERHIVGMADEADPEIVPVLIFIKQFLQLIDVLPGNFRHAGLKAHRQQPVGVVAGQGAFHHGSCRGFLI